FCGGPRKTETRSKIVLVRVIGPPRGESIAWEEQTCRSVREDGRLGARNTPTERAALSVQFWCVVFVAQPQCQSQIVPHFPFILEEAAELLRPDIARSSRELFEFIRESHEEIGTVITRVPRGARRRPEEKLSVDEKVKELIVLIRSEGGTHFELMPALDPG